ncbi:hypothetical protein GIB67_034643 [Kingdonia uniflora]|uniref:Protein kinase domain-containing protein n=1 Tax=Kingdonia uniflora TaxID=39325 RepID=A0A7J7N474_9MAGN|nr:hypothetical protein GIB67_034643 [Kingdonia uniflora]
MEYYNQTIQAPYQIPSTGNNGFLRLDIDGGLRIYTWDWQTGLKVNYVFSSEGSECQFPLKCGKYCLCKDGQCSCLRGVNTNGIKYFTPTNAQFPTMGCSPILASPSNQYHLACSLNPSCKAVFFKYLNSSASNGYYYMPTDVLSMIEYLTMPHNGYNTSSYLKLYLCLATNFFPEKLRRGGFGAVFKGVLKDGTVVAVKRLNSTDQGAKEFSTEFDTFANIYHINLVRLNLVSQAFDL